MSCIRFEQSQDLEDLPPSPPSSDFEFEYLEFDPNTIDFTEATIVGLIKKTRCNNSDLFLQYDPNDNELFDLQTAQDVTSPKQGEFIKCLERVDLDINVGQKLSFQEYDLPCVLDSQLALTLSK